MPEYFYLLAFSPQNLKIDGSFHALKVTLKNVKDSPRMARTRLLCAQASGDAMETAKREIEEALFSREEMSEFRCNLSTQFFKVERRCGADCSAGEGGCQAAPVPQGGTTATATNLTVVAGLFDRNGIMRRAYQKKIEMRLLDETVAKRLGGGLTIRSSFDVKPGTYTCPAGGEGCRRAIDDGAERRRGYSVLRGIGLQVSHAILSSTRSIERHVLVGGPRRHSSGAAAGDPHRNQTGAGGRGGDGEERHIRGRPGVEGFPGLGRQQGAAVDDVFHRSDPNAPGGQKRYIVLFFDNSHDVGGRAGAGAAGGDQVHRIQCGAGPADGGGELLGGRCRSRRTSPAISTG